ncbi:MAG: universal stress protein [Burkholderiales bacterium]|nr:universal stress protein [Burkholderiales bacterium]
MYKTLLVPVDGRPRSLRSLAVASALAERWDAHLVGLFVQPNVQIPSYVRAEGSAVMIDELQRKMLEDLTAQAKARFDEGIRASGAPRTEWRVDRGEAAVVVARHARYADLVIVNQTDPDDDMGSGFADAILLSVGRPVLIVPYVGDAAVKGEHVLVCWDGGREAARAVTDALPILRAARKVTVLTVNTGAGPSEVPGADIALYLARHGVKAEAARTPAGGIDPGNVILSRAFDYGVDLIVMGAYGHSRVREVLLGGATRAILRQMTVPVLMSH